MLCVHFGPGPLGLGLIADQLEEAQFSVCLVGPPGVQPSEREREEYVLAYADPDIGLQNRSLSWACNAVEVCELPRAVLDGIGSSEPLLLTCALGAKIGERVDFIAELLSRRPPGCETLLLACENDPAPEYETLQARCGEPLELVRCVVDRICTKPATTFIDEHGRLGVQTHTRDEHGRRIVSVHPVAEWVIPLGQAEPGAVLRELARASHVVLSREPAAALIERKQWMVGGLHMVLALIARGEGIDLLPLDPALRSIFLQLATPMLERIGEALGARCPGVAPDRQYIEDRVRAFVESPDYVMRILGGLLIRSDLSPLMQRVEMRLGAGARAVAAAGLDCEPFYQAMALLLSVLSDRARYYDRGSWSLDQSRDQAAIELFGKSLAGWLEDERAEDLLALLQRTLAADRLSADD